MKINLKIEGIHCPACKMLIEEICSDYEGIKSVELNEKSGMLILESDIDDFDGLIEEIQESGPYKVKR